MTKRRRVNNSPGQKHVQRKFLIAGIRGQLNGLLSFHHLNATADERAELFALVDKLDHLNDIVHRQETEKCLTPAK